MTLTGYELQSIELKPRDDFDASTTHALVFVTASSNVRTCCYIRSKRAWIWAEPGEEAARVMHRWTKMTDGASFLATWFGFTCFHCGQTFLDAQGCLRHFGRTPDFPARCVVVQPPPR